MDPQQEDAADNMQHNQSYCVSEKCGEGDESLCLCAASVR
jgi:hypothetical protein